jgi:energy-coupling factor transporter ATP-binding protein EcfA2
LTASQNITLPMDLTGQDIDRAWYDELIDRLALGPRLVHHPHELSGGQQQRVAIARSLLSRPQVVFADEPTGSLDSESAREVTRLLQQIVANGSTTLIVVTHDESVAAVAHRVIRVADGVVASIVECRPPNLGVALILETLPRLAPHDSALLPAEPSVLSRPGGGGDTAFAHAPESDSLERAEELGEDSGHAVGCALGGRSVSGGPEGEQACLGEAVTRPFSPDVPMRDAAADDAARP